MIRVAIVEDDKAVQTSCRNISDGMSGSSAVCLS